MREEPSIAAMMIIAIGCLVIGLLLGALATQPDINLASAESYKQGQLDYQAGMIEWQVIDGKLHHITQEAGE